MLDQDNEGGTFGGLEITRRRILFTSGGLNLSTSPVRNSRETRTTGRMANFTFLSGWAKIALMLGDRRLPFAVEFDQLCIKPQLSRAEANQLLEELEWLLLRETVKEPDKGELVGKTKPVMRAPALAELHEIFLGQGGGTLELVAGKHCQYDTAARKCTL